MKKTLDHLGLRVSQVHQVSLKPSSHHYSFNLIFHSLINIGGHGSDTAKSPLDRQCPTASYEAFTDAAWEVRFLAG